MRTSITNPLIPYVKTSFSSINCSGSFHVQILQIALPDMRPSDTHTESRVWPLLILLYLPFRERPRPGHHDPTFSTIQIWVHPLSPWRACPHPPLFFLLPQFRSNTQHHGARTLPPSSSVLQTFSHPGSSNVAPPLPPTSFCDRCLSLRPPFSIRGPHTGHFFHSSSKALGPGFSFLRTPWSLHYPKYLPCWRPASIPLSLLTTPLSSCPMKFKILSQLTGQELW